MTSFNAIDGTIMRALQQDGRLSNVELARKVNLSPSACLRRVQILEQRGAIAKYVALLNPQVLDLTGLAFVFVTLERMSKKDMETFERAVMKPAEVQECFLIAGSNDYLVRVNYRDSTDLERIHTDILMKLPGVIRTQSTLVLPWHADRRPGHRGRHPARRAGRTRSSAGWARSEPLADCG
jgi:Lrp/AsnC family leucine-responsive transcriptional regulator